MSRAGAFGRVWKTRPGACDEIAAPSFAATSSWPCATGTGEVKHSRLNRGSIRDPVTGAAYRARPPRRQRTTAIDGSGTAATPVSVSVNERAGVFEPDATGAGRACCAPFRSRGPHDASSRRREARTRAIRRPRGGSSERRSARSTASEPDQASSTSPSAASNRSARRAWSSPMRRAERPPRTAPRSCARKPALVERRLLVELAEDEPLDVSEPSAHARIVRGAQRLVGEQVVSVPCPSGGVGALVSFPGEMWSGHGTRPSPMTRHDPGIICTRCMSHRPTSATWRGCSAGRTMACLHGRHTRCAARSACRRRTTRQRQRTPGDERGQPTCRDVRLRRPGGSERGERELRDPALRVPGRAVPASDGASRARGATAAAPSVRHTPRCARRHAARPGLQGRATRPRRSREGAVAAEPERFCHARRPRAVPSTCSCPYGGGAHPCRSRRTRTQPVRSRLEDARAVPVAEPSRLGGGAALAALAEAHRVHGLHRRPRSRRHR